MTEQTFPITDTCLLPAQENRLRQTHCHTILFLLFFWPQATMPTPALPQGILWKHLQQICLCVCYHPSALTIVFSNAAPKHMQPNQGGQKCQLIFSLGDRHLCGPAYAQSFLHWGNLWYFSEVLLLCTAYGLLSDNLTPKEICHE